MASRADKRRRARQADSRRHHYVTASYIGLFGTGNGRRSVIHVYDRELNQTRKDVPERVAFEWDLYRLDPGDPPHAFEDALAPLEGKMVEVIREIDRQKSAPTIPQAEAVVSFVALQLVREPQLLEEFHRYSVDVTKLQLEMTARNPEAYEARCQQLLADDPTLTREDLPTAEEILESLRDPVYEIRMNNGFVVTSAFKAQDPIFRALAEMKLGFHLVASGQESLVTGSRPVLLIPHPDTPPMMGVGVKTAAAITMALTPNLLFMARPDQAFEIVYTPAHPALVSANNRHVSQQSRLTFSRTPLSFDPTALDKRAVSQGPPPRSTAGSRSPTT